MIKVALVGVGGMGSTHFNLYCQMQDVQVVALVDVEIDRIKEKAETCGANTYTDIDSMLENETPDFVDICTPSYTHASLSMKVMAHGRHVLSEKPAALVQDEIRAVYRCAKENGVFFMAAHVLRFWYEYHWLKETVDKKCYGNLQRAHFFRTGEKPRTSWNNWMLDEEKSGLVPFDLHIHDVDYMIYLLGYPQKADAFELRNGQTTNYIHASYCYPNDLHVTAEAAWYSAKLPFSMGYEAVFEEGYAEFRADKLTYYPNDGEPQLISSEEKNSGSSEINVSNMGGYYDEIRYFIRCIETKTEPSVIKETELLDTLRLIKQECEIARKSK